MRYKLYVLLLKVKIMGKASKKLKNINAKVKAKESESEIIKNMNDVRSYSINGISLTGKLWKEYYKEIIK